MKRQDRAAVVAATLTNTIGEILEEERLDLGEALVVMQLVARSLQAAVDTHTLLAVEKFRDVPYTSPNGGRHGE